MEKVGIVCNPKKREAKEVLSQLIDWLLKKGLEVSIEESALAIIPRKEFACPPGQLAGRSDMIIAMGGDGTLLKASRLVGRSPVPILGVNIGSLGFLTETLEQEVYAIMEDVVQGSYEVEERMVLEAILQDDAHRFYALNDMVFMMGESGRIVEIVLHVSGEYVCTFPADGVIISTPTGSTAYSLAAGGPIVYPRMDCILVTPICAHSLGVRPMVIPSNETIRTTVRSRAEDARLIVDGQESFQLKSGADVQIKKADYHIRLVKPKAKSFFEVLRTKLRWGGREEDSASGAQS